jgi:RimJ/RimL family protein N-acetyltransferase
MLTLEPLGKRHLEWLRCLRNANREWFNDSRLIETHEQQYRWFRESTDRGDLNLVIRDADSDDLVGFISVYEILPGGSAVIGRMMIGEKFKRQSYMERAIIRVFDICKYAMAMSHLNLEVKSENIPARQLYSKLGFVDYGFTANTRIMRKIF